MRLRPRRLPGWPAAGRTVPLPIVVVRPAVRLQLQARLHAGHRVACLGRAFLGPSAVVLAAVLLKYGTGLGEGGERFTQNGKKTVLVGGLRFGFWFGVGAWRIGVRIKGGVTLE